MARTGSLSQALAGTGRSASAGLQLPAPPTMGAVLATGAISLGVGLAIGQGGPSAWVLVGLGLGGALFVTFGQLGFRTLTAWVVFSGFAYPFVRYPHAHTIFTFDRLWIGAMLACVFLGARELPAARRTRSLYLALGWLTISYGIRAALTHGAAVRGLQAWVDAIVLPLVLFAVANRFCSTRQRIERLVLALMIGGVGLALLGLAERSMGFELASRSGGVPRFDQFIGAVRIAGPYTVPET